MTVSAQLSLSLSLARSFSSIHLFPSLKLWCFWCLGSESIERDQGFAGLESSLRVGGRRSMRRRRPSAVVRRHLLHSRRLPSRHRVVSEFFSVSFDSIVWEYLVKRMSSLILFCKFAGRFMQCQSLGLFLLLSPISWISLGCKATSLIYSHSLIYVTRCWIDKLKMQTLRTRIVSVLSKLNTSSLFSRTCYICMWLSPFYRDLHNNKLTGPIPPQIGRLKRLKILYSPFFLISLFCYKTHAVALIYAIYIKCSCIHSQDGILHRVCTSLSNRLVPK